MLSYPSISMMLWPWSKGSWLLLELAAEFGIIHMVLILPTRRMQDLWSYETSTEISEKGQEGQAVCP